MKLSRMLMFLLLSMFLVSCSGDLPAPREEASAVVPPEPVLPVTECTPSDLPPGIATRFGVAEVSSSVRKDGMPRRTAVISLPQGTDPEQAFAEIADALTGASYVSKSSDESAERIQRSFSRSGVGSVYLTLVRKQGAPALLSMSFPDQCGSP